MQFMPATWKRWGVDANGDGVADPYNPVDAIFSAARYLRAAGAAQNLPRAIFAYNHASWYVQSVLLRAQLIGGMPAILVGALTGLVQGHFPVAATARYVDGGRAGTKIYASSGSPVIAVNDGKILKVSRGTIELQDTTGNIYTYQQLGSVPALYRVPRPVIVTAAQIAAELQQAVTHVASLDTVAPATAGVQRAPVTLPTVKTYTSTIQTAVVKERLFANPVRPASYAAGGRQQIQATTGQQISNFRDYFTDTLQLAPSQYTLQPLKAGAIVVAGTVLGRLGHTARLLFRIRPAGRAAPYIDPKPILDGWKLLEASALYRTTGADPFLHRNPSSGQVLLLTKRQLQERILTDTHVQLLGGTRRQIQAGQADQRVLAVIEFLQTCGLEPTITTIGAGGTSVTIAALNHIPVAHHQGTGSLTDIAARTLRTLQGADAPARVITLPGHLLITYATAYKWLLRPNQWIQLIQRIGQIPEPTVPLGSSQYSVRR
jgi:hypothetical protein